VTLLLSLALHGVYARASSARTRENAQHAHRLVELNRAYKLLRPHRRELAEIGVYALVLLGLVIAHF
jgi:hypothetical protein